MTSTAHTQMIDQKLIHGLVLVAILAVSAAAPGRTSAASPPTAEERIECATVLERHEWERRSWPEDNPGPKPSFDQVMPPEVVGQRVDDTIGWSNLLAERWGVVLDAEAMQWELDRMVRESRDPEALEALFAVFDHDPVRIAECVVRPRLAENRARALFAVDDELHREARAEAENLWDRWRRFGDAAMDGAAVHTIRYVRGGERGRDPEATWLDRDAWDVVTEALARRLSPPGDPAKSDAAEDLPLNSVSALQEETARFTAVRVDARGADHLQVSTLVVPKRDFDTWWREVSDGFARGSARERAAGELDVASAELAMSIPAVAKSSSTDGQDPGSWIRVAPASIAARERHHAVWTGSEMIVFGGVDGSTYHHSGGRYHPGSASWGPIADAPVVFSRGSSAAVWTGSEILVFGFARSGAQSYRLGYRYDPATDVWTPMANDLFTPDCHGFDPSAVWTGTAMFYVGAEHFTDDTHWCKGSYVPATDTWGPMGNNAPDSWARERASMVWTGSEVLLFGGLRTDDFVEAAQDDLLRYSGGTWTLTDTDRAARADHTAVWTGSEMIIWGGFVPPFAYSNTGDRYNPTTDTWSAVSTVSAPAGRTDHTAVWTGSQMNIWGGEGSGGTALGTGGRYIASSNTWVSTSTVADPAPRSNHSAVWTGLSMLVWGGHDGANARSDGKSYSPGFDSWSTIPAPLGPNPTAFASATWTGNELVVFGGQNAGTATQATWQYRPTSNSWFQTNSSGAPSARWGHTAVWTGTEVLIFGGYDGSDEHAEGARFSPISDAWGVMNPALSKRQGHTAVWSGTEMIVFGGRDGDTYLGNGARYSPSGNGWGSISSANRPTARAGHTAVWSGTEMIVFGGEDTAQHFDDGARYVPGGAWAALPDGPSSSFWEPRSNHGAVWVPPMENSAGDGMLVHGGVTGSGAGSVTDIATATWMWRADLDEWVRLANHGASSHRESPIMVWTGLEAFSWGGLNDSGQWGDFSHRGFRVDPWALEVNPLPTPAGEPTGRFGHVAAWRQTDGPRGGQLMVWGGFGDTDGGSIGWLDTGGLHRPDSRPVVQCRSADASLVVGGPMSIRCLAHSVDGYDGDATPVTVGCSGNLDCPEQVFTPAPGGIESAQFDVVLAPSTAGGTWLGLDSTASTGPVDVFVEIGDFDVSCTEPAVTLAPNTSTTVTCHVDSVAPFAAATSLSCTPSGGVQCSTDTSTTAPPSGGSVAFDVDIDAGSSSGSFFVEVAGEHDTVFRFVAIDVTVEDETPSDVIFIDGFEDGTMDQWSE
jgi:hypothetical protein